MNRTTVLLGMLLLGLVSIPNASAIGPAPPDRCESETRPIHEEICLVQGIAYESAQMVDNILEGQQGPFEELEDWQDNVDECWKDYAGDLLLGEQPDCEYDDDP